LMGNAEGMTASGKTPGHPFQGTCANCVISFARIPELVA
jgi:hypothetical protein